QTVAASLPAGRTALVFGSEKTGLGVEEISFCHRLARIPTRPDAPSMNLGQAVAICAYELARTAPGEPAAGHHPVITAEERERLTAEQRERLTAEQRERLVETWY